MKEQYYYNYEVVFFSDFDDKMHKTKGMVAAESVKEAFSIIRKYYEGDVDCIDKVSIEIIDDSYVLLELSDEVVKNE